MNSTTTLRDKKKKSKVKFNASRRKKMIKTEIHEIKTIENTSEN